jgi:hypothetical protein
MTAAHCPRASCAAPLAAAQRLLHAFVQLDTTARTTLPVGRTTPDAAVGVAYERGFLASRMAEDYGKLKPLWSEFKRLHETRLGVSTPLATNFFEAEPPFRGGTQCGYT